MRLFDILTDGGATGAVGGEAHYECRECGTNVDPDAATCPECGGDVAVYTF
jgi:rubrerythrin